MKHLTVMITDNTGKVIDIQNVTTLDAATACNTPVQSSWLSDPAQASEYLTNLRAIYGLQPVSSPSRVASRASGKRKRVKCHTTGQIFDSAAAAARYAGCSTSYMVRRLRHATVGKEDIGGYVYGYDC